VEHACDSWCEKNKAALVAYSPFGHGDFPGPRTAGGRLLEAIAGKSAATPRAGGAPFLLRFAVFVCDSQSVRIPSMSRRMRVRADVSTYCHADRTAGEGVPVGSASPVASNAVGATGGSGSEYLPAPESRFHPSAHS